MEPPKSGLTSFLASASLILGGAALGDFLAGQYQTNAALQTSAKSTGAALGGLLVSLGALSLGAAKPAWSSFGINTALMGVGLYTAGAVALATAPGAPLSLQAAPASTPALT